MRPFFLMIRRPPRSTLDRSSAASDVYKRQAPPSARSWRASRRSGRRPGGTPPASSRSPPPLSLIHISEPTRQAEISYAVFCLKKKTKKRRKKKQKQEK